MVNGTHSPTISFQENFQKCVTCRFQLYYYSDHVKTEDRMETLLTIDSRHKKVNNNYDEDADEFDSDILDPLEKAIQTK